MSQLDKETLRRIPLEAFSEGKVEVVDEVLAAVEDRLPCVVVAYSLLHDEDHDRLSSESGAPLLARSARLPVIVSRTCLLYTSDAANE